MSTVTPRLNLTKAEGIEQYSLPLQNANLDKIDAASVSIEEFSATFNSGSFDFTGTRWVRVAIKGGIAPKGIVVANYLAVIDTGAAVTFPAGTDASGLAFDFNITPEGLRPKQQIGWVTGALVSDGANIPLAGRLDTNGQLRFRSETTSSATIGSAVAGTKIRWNVIYPWIGVE